MAVWVGEAGPGERGELGSPPDTSRGTVPPSFTLVRRAESTLSGPDLDFSKFENQLRCLLIASLALIFRSGLSGGCLVGLVARLTPFLSGSAVLDTELERDSRERGGLGERSQLGGWEVWRELSLSVLLPGLPGWQTLLARLPAGLTTLLVLLLLSSNRLSPLPIRSNSARALEKRSW